MKQISIAIPTFNRHEMTLEAFAKVLDDERIAEVVINDDASQISSYNALKASISLMPKVKLFRNATNQGGYKNKMKSISLCSSQYCVILDSDNIIGKDYLDAIYNEEWNEKLILAPSFAKPELDYREFSNLIVTKENVNQHFDKPKFSFMLNTFNLFINRNECNAVHSKTFDATIDPVASDAIYFNYCWLLEGNKIKVVDKMEYEHRIHSGSYWMNNPDKSIQFYETLLLPKIKQLK
jgi:glycosyltransferase involved in cell wall biosynthesis